MQIDFDLTKPSVNSFPAAKWRYVKTIWSYLIIFISFDRGSLTFTIMSESLKISAALLTIFPPDF